MQVLIPFSGGVNSTFALWRWLSETDHEITAVYAQEKWQDVLRETGREAREKEAADKMAAWLKDNVRDFEYEVVDWPIGYSEKQTPIREGGSSTMDEGIMEPRYHGYKKLIDDKSPDGIVTGISLENTAADTHPRYRALFETDGVDIYFAGSRELTPISKGDAFDYDALAADMMGRYEQLGELPDELVALMESKCPERHDPRVDSSNLCMACLYEIVHEEVTDKTGKELDEAFARHGSYGKWRNEIDLETYVYRGNPQKLALELLGIEAD